MTADTKHIAPFQFKPGQVANPAGRPRGSKTLITRAFLADVKEAWDLYGKASLRVMAHEDPAGLCRLVGSLVDRHDTLRIGRLEEYQEAELDRLDDQMETALLELQANGSGAN